MDRITYFLFSIAEAEVYPNRVEFSNDGANWTEDLVDSLVDINENIEGLLKLREVVLEQIKLKEDV